MFAALLLVKNVIIANCEEKAVQTTSPTSTPHLFPKSRKMAEKKSVWGVTPFCQKGVSNVFAHRLHTEHSHTHTLTLLLFFFLRDKAGSCD